MDGLKSVGRFLSCELAIYDMMARNLTAYACRQSPGRPGWGFRKLCNLMNA